MYTEWDRDGSVGKVTTVRAGRSRVRMPTRARGFSVLLSEQTGSEALFKGTVVKRPRREADYSPPPSAKVKNGWTYTTAPPIRLHCVDRSGFYLYLYLIAVRKMT